MLHLLATGATVWLRPGLTSDLASLVATLEAEFRNTRSSRLFPSASTIVDASVDPLSIFTPTSWPLANFPDNVQSELSG